MADSKLVDQEGLKDILTDIKPYTVSSGQLDEIQKTCDEILEAVKLKDKKLSDCSWEEISEIAEAGYAQYRFNVGDEKSIFYNGKECLVRIVDFYYYPKTGGSGKAGIVFQFEDLIPNYYVRINNSSNEGGWDKMEIKTTTLPKLLDSLYTDKDEKDPLSNYVKSVTIRCDRGVDYQNESYTTESTDNKLFLPSIAEYYSPNGIAEDSSFPDSNQYRDRVLATGSQFLYYRNLIGDKTPDSYPFNFSDWQWTRNAYLGDGNSWLDLNSGGDLDDGGVNDDGGGVVPCFCI